MYADAALKSLPQVTSVALFGDKLHLTVNDEAAARTAVMGELQARAIVVRGFERIEPSLEDAFVAIIERSGEAGSRQ